MSEDPVPTVIVQAAPAEPRFIVPVWPAVLNAREAWSSVASTAPIFSTLNLTAVTLLAPFLQAVSNSRAAVSMADTFGT